MTHFIQKTSLLALGFFLVLSSGVQAQDADHTLKNFLTLAQEQNPAIQRAYQDWQAAEYRAKHVRSLDDPMFSYGYFGEEIKTRVGPQEQKFGVSQKVPFPGKLGLKGKTQQEKAKMLEQEYQAVRNEVFKNVKFTYFDLYWVDRAIAVNEEENDILEKSERVAQRRYESNLTPQQNVVKLQVELSKIIQKQTLLRQNRKSLQARMNALLNRAPDEMIPVIPEVPDISFVYSLDKLQLIAEDRRQELKAAEHAVNAAEHEKSLARMAYLPDFTVGAEFIEIGGGTTSATNDGQDAWVGMVSVNVPIWFGKLDNQLKEKQAQLKSALNRRDSLQDQVQWEVADAYYKIKSYQEITVLYETALMPQARQAFEASESGFETGSVSFLDWLDAERTFLQTRLAYYQTKADFYKSVATLERVLGQDLERSLK